MNERKCRFIDLSRITNKNEKRVITAMEKILAETGDKDLEALDIQDIYALTLNRLPPRYVQEGTIVFNEPVKKEEIERVVSESIKIVREKPNY